jgi:predicted transcriptional regulator
MNMLWPMGEGTVREIRDALAPRRPRAYTTIMTIMDRLARKGVVERRKTGRAYVYRPNLTADNARAQALAQVIESFFGGSRESLMAHLDGAQPKSRALAAAVASVAASSLAPAKVSASPAGAGSAAAPPADGTSAK